MRLGWRIPRVDSLKLAKLHKNWECAWSTQENFRFSNVAVVQCITTGVITDTDLFEPLWSSRLNYQLMTKPEMMHILQAQHRCAAISTNPGLPNQKTKRATSDASKSQLNQANWNNSFEIWLSKSNKRPCLTVNHFLRFSLNRTIWKKSCQYQFD